MSRGIRIEGRTLLGDLVAEFILAHGADPAEELAARGWSYTAVAEAFAREGDEGAVIRASVVPLIGEGSATTRLPAAPGQEPLPHDVEVRVHQRLSACAVVIRDGAILLTELSGRVFRGGGDWTLPGGGVDRGEDPAIGVRREVWEETGQHLGPVELIDLVTSRWVGRAPSGRWEDYQVVRLIYRATVPQPEPLVVHDADGTTASAAWVPLADLPALPRAPLIAHPRVTDWLGIPR